MCKLQALWEAATAHCLTLELTLFRCVAIIPFKNSLALNSIQPGMLLSNLRDCGILLIVVLRRARVPWPQRDITYSVFGAIG